MYLWRTLILCQYLARPCQYRKLRNGFASHDNDCCQVMGEVLNRMEPVPSLVVLQSADSYCISTFPLCSCHHTIYATHQESATQADTNHAKKQGIPKGKARCRSMGLNIWCRLLTQENGKDCPPQHGDLHALQLITANAQPTHPRDLMPTQAASSVDYIGAGVMYTYLSLAA